MTANTVFWKDPELPFIEARHSLDSASIYNPHFHEELSIGLIEDGTTVYSVNGKTFTLNTGELVIINPHAVHTCNPEKGEKRTYSMLYISADYCRQIDKGIFSKIDRCFQKINSTVKNEKLLTEYKLLNETLFNSGSFYIEKEERLQIFLGNLFNFFNHIDLEISVDTKLPMEKLEIRTVNGPVMLAKKYLDKNVFVNPTISEISDYAGVSRFHLIRRFSAETGITPHAYLLNKKIGAAKELLTSGVPVSAVAVDLGFYDQSHFNRVFKSLVAATPFEYHKSLS